MERAGRPEGDPLKLAVFYQKIQDRHLPHLDNHAYTFELGTQDELERSAQGQDARKIRTIDISRFPAAARNVLVRHYEKYNETPTRVPGNPSCGYITYQILGSGRKRVAFATKYYPRNYIHSEGEKKERRRPEISALFERLSLAHLIPRQKVTHVATFDALEKNVHAPGDEKNRAALSLRSSAFTATRAREAQLARKRIKPEKAYLASAWEKRLGQQRQHLRRFTVKVAAKSRRGA